MLRDDLDQGQRAALASWTSFATTFAAVRGITYSIRAGKGPFGNVSLGGEHLHHYMWGIGIRLVAVATEHAREARCEWLHVDFDDELIPFYFDGCGFRPTNAGLIALGPGGS